MEEITKTGTITYTKVDGEIKEVKTDLHINELFKIIHHLRAKISPERDPLKDMQCMGWHVPQLENKK